MKKKILILAGGYSKEREISFQTAKAVFKQIKKDFKCKILDPSKGFIKKIRKFKPDIVFNALHGRYGEDGYIQSVLEIEKIKYTHSGVLASSICINKLISKKIFKKNKILTPKFIIIKQNINSNPNNIFKFVNKKFKFPVVIKPINEGSSVGVYICNKKNFIRNLRKLKPEKEILVENYIPGREIQVAIIGNKKLGTIELVPKRKFYDYKAKYDKSAKTRHVIPVDLPPKKIKEVENIALKAHKITGCKGVTRSDFRFNNNKFYLLEVNTQPGMTELSLVPEIARFKGMNFYNLINWIINDASINR
ncbi:D-alanine--D-alanine ligase [Candidatus Pelagibacter sp.]|nr:D-alanine--D-alanine ligase [Candidatus Pelagibacter sp.]